MTFNQAIQKIMHEVDSGAKEPFIIFRNQDGGWHCDTTVHQYGQEYDWVEDIQDPFALKFTGADFANGSFPYVYDKVLTERLRAEYESTFIPGADPDELKALIHLMEENIGEFSSEVTNYLTLFDRPLAALYEMTPISLVTDSEDYDYDPGIIQHFVEEVKDEVNNRLHNLKKQEIPIGLEGEETGKSGAKEMGGYEEKLCIKLAGQFVIFAEHPTEEAAYLSGYVKHGVCYDHEIFADYVEAMRDFTNKLDELVNELETERNVFGLAAYPLTTGFCLQESYNDDFTGKLIIVRASELSPEYRSAEHQLVLCSHGNGARPDAIGTSVFGTELHSGKTVCFGRHQIEGVADPEKLPSWAARKFALHEKLNEPGVFNFGGYHFKPYRKYNESEMSADKTISDSTFRRMGSDFGLGLSSYDWKQNGVDYSHANFYAASGESNADIFMCIENGKLYIPAENEIFVYREAPQKTQKKTAPNRKPTLKQKMGKAQKKVRDTDAAKPENNSKSKPKRDERE